MNEKKTYAGDSGKMHVQNVSRKESQVYFMFEVEAKRKTFMQKLKDLFCVNAEKHATVYLDRANAKHLSSQIYNAILDADKHYKAENQLKKANKTGKSA